MNKSLDVQRTNALKELKGKHKALRHSAPPVRILVTQERINVATLAKISHQNSVEVRVRTLSERGSVELKNVCTTNQPAQNLPLANRQVRKFKRWDVGVETKRSAVHLPGWKKTTTEE